VADTKLKRAFHLSNPPVKDPAGLSYPPTFPLEIALRTSSVKSLCEDYSISSEQWARLIHDDVFRAEVDRYLTLLQKEGMSFKLKALLQSDELLKTSWQLIHDETGDVPPSVKAQLIVHTHKVAGLIPSNAEGGGGGVVVPLQINIDLG
jgi:hypothetical protein